MTSPNGAPTAALTRTLRLFSSGDGLAATLRAPDAFVDALPGFAMTPVGPDGVRALHVDGDQRSVQLVPLPGDEPAWRVVQPGDASASARIDVRHRTRTDGCTLDIVASAADGALDRPTAELAVAALYQLALNIEAATPDDVHTADTEEAPTAPADAPVAPSEGRVGAAVAAVGSRNLAVGAAAAGLAALLLGWVLRRRSSSRGR